MYSLYLCNISNSNYPHVPSSKHLWLEDKTSPSLSLAWKGEWEGASLCHGKHYTLLALHSYGSAVSCRVSVIQYIFVLLQIRLTFLESTDWEVLGSYPRLLPKGFTVVEALDTVKLKPANVLFPRISLIFMRRFSTAIRPAVSLTSGLNQYVKVFPTAPGKWNLNFLTLFSNVPLVVTGSNSAIV